VCSVIRPTATQGAAMGALKFLTDDGLFRGQSAAFRIGRLEMSRRQAPRGRRPTRSLERFPTSGQCSRVRRLPVPRPLVLRHHVRPVIARGEACGEDNHRWAMISEAA
jgi:hypothetical protein